MRRAGNRKGMLLAGSRNRNRVFNWPGARLDIASMSVKSIVYQDVTSSPRLFRYMCGNCNFNAPTG